MAMQYFSRIAHIDSQRRKRPGRSEKKMCVCVRDGGWAVDEEEREGERRSEQDHPTVTRGAAHAHTVPPWDSAFTAALC